MNKIAEMNSFYSSLPGNYYANGGNMKQLTEFNEGGTHEQNPLGGIPQGMNPDGQPNLVEQGETKLDSKNYIYSDSLKVDKNIATQFNLSKSDVGKTFADVSKRMNRPNSRRENDSIEKEAIKRDLDSLMNAQETFKKMEVEKKMAEIQSLDPSMFTAPQSPAPQIPMEQPPMDPSMMQQPMMRQGGHMFDGGGNLSSNPYANPNSLESQGFRDFSAGTAAQPTETQGGNAMGQVGSYAGAALGAVNAYQSAQQGAGTQQQKTGAGINSGIDAAAGTLTPWYGLAKGASNLGKGMINSETVTDPTTGKTVTQAKSKEGQALSDTFTPAHETIINDMTEGNWIDAGLDTLTGGVYNTLDNYFKGTNQKEFNEIQENIKNPNGKPGYVATNGIPLQQTFKLGGNMYAQGGMFEMPMPPDNAPAGTTFNLKDRNTWMGDYTTSIPMGHDLNSPIDSLPGIDAQIKAGMATPNYKTVGEYVTAREDWERTHAGTSLSPSPVSLTSVSSTPTTVVPAAPVTYPGFTKQPGRLDARPINASEKSSEQLSNDLQLKNALIDQERAMNQQRIANTPPDVLKAQRDERFNFSRPKQFALGGPLEDEIWGDVPGDVYNPTKGFDPSTVVEPTPDAFTSEDTLSLAEEKMKNATTEEEFAQAELEYQSELKRASEELKDKNLNLNMNQSLGQGISQMIPAGYNIGMGLFSKAEKLNPSDYYQKADIKPWEFNIDPQLRQADQTFAQGQNAARNAAIGGGEYLSNMQQMANSRNQAYGDLYAQKQNIDAQNYQQALLQNKNIEAQNIQSRLGVEDYNRQAKAAKTAMLQTGLKQLAEAGRSSQDNDLQTNYLKVLAPDFANSFEYNTIFDQAKKKASTKGYNPEELKQLKKSQNYQSETK